MCNTIGADIVIRTESWLSDQHMSTKYFPSNYNVYRRDRKSLIRTDLQCLEPEELKPEKTMRWSGSRLQLPEAATSGLGHLFFLVFFNDLPDHLTSDTSLFAENAIIYHQIHTVEDQAILQDNQVKLAEWEQLLDMEFHPQRSSYLTLSRASKTKTYKCIHKVVILAEESSTKYLLVDQRQQNKKMPLSR